MNFIDEKILEYSDGFTGKESELLEEIRLNTTKNRDDSAMLSGFHQGRFLAMLSKLMSPHCILEIGTYVGYSTLCFAEGLSRDGKIHTIDINEENINIANSYFKKSEYKNKIIPLLGNALGIIHNFNETIDMVFIDADKTNYINYYEAVLPKMRTGGLIIADNVLWSGKVLDAAQGKEADEDTKALHRFNEIINNDNRVENVLLPLRDGLMLARKKC
jgi:caffeoyl-CoA O-methyltransferase